MLRSLAALLSPRGYPRLSGEQREIATHGVRVICTGISSRGYDIGRLLFRGTEAITGSRCYRAEYDNSMAIVRVLLRV